VTAEEVGFPFARQIARIDRERTILSSGKRSCETLYLITSLDAASASPARLLELIRGHWVIENNLHYCRDRTFDEDRCQVRNPNGAQVMASLRNLAISLSNLRQNELPLRRRSLPSSQRRFALKLHTAVHLVAKKE
jgi:predicted transposase YbfD/YdcC